MGEGLWKRTGKCSKQKVGLNEGLFQYELGWHILMWSSDIPAHNTYLPLIFLGLRIWKIPKNTTFTAPCPRKQKIKILVTCTCSLQFFFKETKNYGIHLICKYIIFTRIVLLINILDLLNLPQIHLYTYKFFFQLPFNKRKQKYEQNHKN